MILLKQLHGLHGLPGQDVQLIVGMEPDIAGENAIKKCPVLYVSLVTNTRMVKKTQMTAMLAYARLHLYLHPRWRR